MAFTPLVSIIIPCYNGEKYVAEAIQSALSQTFEDVEIIVVDDGSKDGSLEVIKGFGDRVIWETGPNRGGCTARNRGLAIARGAWIQFLDADDRMTPRKIESQMKALGSSSTPNAIAVCPWRHFVDDHLEVLSNLSVYKTESRGVDFLVDMWRLGDMFPPHCWLTPRSLIDAQGGWNRDLTADQDGEFFGRMLVASDEIVFVFDEEAHYRMPQAGNVSSMTTKRALECRFEAWDTVRKQLLLSRNDLIARRAVLRRLRSVGYQLRAHDDLINRADACERELSVWDLQFSIYGLLCFAVGLKHALMLRALGKSIVRGSVITG